VTPLILVFIPLGSPAVPIDERDLQAFPSSTVARFNWQAAERHCEWGNRERQSRLSPWNPWEAWYPQAEWRRRCWYVLDDAHTYRGERRLRALQQLRELLGPEAYRAGSMPTSCPFEMFRDVDAP
jgi:hypothetical protein